MMMREFEEGGQGVARRVCLLLLALLVLLALLLVLLGGRGRGRNTFHQYRVVCEVCERARVSERVCKVNKKCRVKSVESRTKGKNQKIKGSTPKSSNLGLYRAVVGSLSTPHNGTRYTVHTPHHPSPGIQHSAFSIHKSSCSLFL